MQELRGRIAVVTGAASGIGLGLAQRAAREGMTVILTDIEEKPLQAAVATLEDTGAKAIATVPTSRTPPRSRRSPPASSKSSAPATCSATTPVSSRALSAPPGSTAPATGSG